MGQRRYLDLLGNPAGKPLRYTFHRAADVKATLYSAIVAACSVFLLPQDTETSTPAPESSANVTSGTTKAGPNPMTWEIAATNTTIKNVIDLVLLRWIEKLRLDQNRFDIEKKCIDTQPDTDAPPTSPDDLLKAVQMKDYYRFLGILYAAISGTYAITTFLTHGMSPRTVVDIANDSASLTRLYSGYDRYNKVLTGEWRIINMPTPEKIAEAEKKPVEMKTPELAPV